MKAVPAKRWNMRLIIHLARFQPQYTTGQLHILPKRMPLNLNHQLHLGLCSSQVSSSEDQHELMPSDAPMVGFSNQDKYDQEDPSAKTAGVFANTKDWIHKANKIVPSSQTYKLLHPPRLVLFSDKDG